jgi:hypothetical protein
MKGGVMKRAYDFSAGEIQSYLSKGWLTHDGMWLLNAYLTVGVEKGNELNRGAIRSMAAIEMKRTRELLGVQGKPASIAELEELMESALELLLPLEVRREFSMGIAGDSSIKWSWNSGACFAYRGVKKMGMLDQYRCGVIYRIECWLRELGYRFRVEPVVEGCLMKEGGLCAGEFIIDFQEA